MPKDLKTQEDEFLKKQIERLRLAEEVKLVQRFESLLFEEVEVNGES